MVARYHITLAGPDDAPLVHEIVQRAFAEYRGKLQPPSSAHDETVFTVAEELRKGGAIIAWDGMGGTAGAARFKPKREKYLYVGRVSVLPAHRGRGLATQMMRFVHEHAKRMGFDQIRLGVRESLPSNMRLYQGLGYETIAVEPHPRGPGFNTLTMRIRL